LPSHMTSLFKAMCFTSGKGEERGKYSSYSTGRLSPVISLLQTSFLVSTRCSVPT
jgi:hypothetical protein